MKIINEVPAELKRLVNYIQKRNGDCESMLNGYNNYRIHNGWNHGDYTWYGHSLICEPLFASYGTIGYRINYRGFDVEVDNDMNKIHIE